jgi:RNA polymerase sigma factor (sigma-70 family)
MDTDLAEPELADGAAAPAAGDDELLRRFVATRDEQAFGELVRRHSGLVLGVCRRTLRDEHDAEEAFQATFLVLAAKAAQLRTSATIGPWLYGVAYRIAIRAAAKRARRREAALPDDVAMIEDALQGVAECHWQRVLDDEINLLPEKYRGAVVLHYLLGKTNKEVAAELGLSERTVEGRQRRGKELLKRRLMSRGVTLPLALGALAASSAKSATAAPPLIDATIQAGMSFVNGNCAACSAHAARLAQSEVLAMSSSMTPLSATLVAVLLLGGALTMAGGHGAAQGDGPLPLSAAVVALAVDEAAAGDSEAVLEIDASIQTAGAESQPAATVNDDDADNLEPSRTDLFRRSNAEQRIISRLRSRMPPMDYVEQPLGDVMTILGEEIDCQIWFDKVAMEEAGISADAEVSCSLQGLPLKSALRLLLGQLRLTYLVKDDVLVITTEEKASLTMEPHVYKLDSIVSSSAGLAELAEVIPETIRPDTWSATGQGEGTIKMLGQNLLVINQTPEVHDALESFFEQLYEGGVHIEGTAKPEQSSH